MSSRIITLFPPNLRLIFIEIQKQYERVKSMHQTEERDQLFKSVYYYMSKEQFRIQPRFYGNQIYIIVCLLCLIVWN